MNQMGLFFVGFLVLSSAIASSADLVADYVVPTNPKLVAHSRFKVEIVRSYIGTSSNEISYIFPRELTGEPGLLVKFRLIDMDEDSRVSYWDSQTMTAVCTDDGKKVQCNIYVKKTTRSQLFEQQLSSLSGHSLSIKEKPLLDSSKAIDFLKNSGLPKEVITDKLKVLNQFLNSEPGGILSYEYK